MSFCSSNPIPYPQLTNTQTRKNTNTIKKILATSQRLLLTLSKYFNNSLCAPVIFRSTSSTLASILCITSPCS